MSIILYTGKVLASLDSSFFSLDFQSANKFVMCYKQFFCAEHKKLLSVVEYLHICVCVMYVAMSTLKFVKIVH